MRHHARMLAGLGTPLARGARVLDFGCGEGQHVYDYREEGYDAYGFEIAPIVKLRRPEDARFFGFASTAAAGSQDYRVDKTTFRVPFESDSFDFVFSSETFEHVTEYDAAFAEIARVLKPGGTSIHTFPSRYRLLEPHTKVPLGGVFQGHAWHLLWALLGVRNEFQRGVGPFARARQNVDFMKKCVNYLSTGEILRHAAAHFKEADLVPHLWLLANDGYGCQGALCMLVPLYRALYAKMGEVVLYVRKC
ncbi:MAG: class I SAM-dependent methyltransferase [Planctomycetota bacterium]